jgi:POT family proton-dependent oligopeptide transporter
MVYAEKNVGYWLAYLLPTVVFCMTPLVLWFGRNRYVRSPPSGSVLVSAIRIWRYAARGRWSANPTTLIRNFQSETFYDQAKPSNVVAAGHEKPRWMTFDDRWVDEVRRGIKACIVFLWIPLYCAFPLPRSSPHAHDADSPVQGSRTTS